MKKAISHDAESGQTMTEYAVVLGVISFTIVATFSLLSGAINAAFQRIVEIVQSGF